MLLVSRMTSVCFSNVTDDRAVRDSERKAAIMHFSTEQATQLTEHPKTPEPAEVQQTHPRIKHVKSLAKPAHGKIVLLFKQECLSVEGPPPACR